MPSEATGPRAKARRVTGSGMVSKRVDAIIDVFQEAAEHGDHVTPEGLRAELTILEARLGESILDCHGPLRTRIIAWSKTWYMAHRAAPKTPFFVVPVAVRI